MAIITLIVLVFIIATVAALIEGLLSLRAARGAEAALTAEVRRLDAVILNPQVNGLWRQEVLRDILVVADRRDAERAGVEYLQRAVRRIAWVLAGASLFGGMTFSAVVQAEANVAAVSSLEARAEAAAVGAAVAQARAEAAFEAAQEAVIEAEVAAHEARVAADQALAAALEAGVAADAHAQASAALAQARADAKAWRTLRALPTWAGDLGDETRARYEGAFGGAL